VLSSFLRNDYRSFQGFGCIGVFCFAKKAFERSHRFCETTTAPFRDLVVSAFFALQKKPLAVEAVISELVSRCKSLVTGNFCAFQP